MAYAALPSPSRPRCLRQAAWRPWRSLQVPRLCGRVPPGVVASVGVVDGGADEFGRLGVVQCGQLDGHVIAAYLLDVASLEGAHAAVFAKQVVAAFAAELVVA